MDVNAMMGEALKLMGIGVSSVFLVLGVFYLMVIVLKKLFPSKESPLEEKETI